MVYMYHSFLSHQYTIIIKTHWKQTCVSISNRVRELGKGEENEKWEGSED